MVSIYAETTKIDAGWVVICFLLYDTSKETITNRKYTFSDGKVVYDDTTATNIFTTYGRKSVTVSFQHSVNGSYYGKWMTLSKDFDIKNPNEGELDGILKEDVFKSKPIIIPAECTGDITLTATIEDLNGPGEVYKETAYSTSIGYSINFGTVLVPGNTRISLPFDKSTNTATTFVGSPGTRVTDADNINKIGYIPAFYQTGNVNITYSIVDTEDTNSNFDVVWDLWMEFPTLETQVPWMEGNYATSSQIFKNIIRSDNAEANFASVAEYSIDTKQFNISTWNGIPPFVIKEFIDEPATTIMIKRAMLADPKFYVVAQNKLSSNVTLGFVLVEFTWNFNPHDLLMNMSPNWTSRQKRQKIFTLPKGAEATRRTGLDFPLYAVVDGYKRFSATKPDEIVKVYAQWDEYHDDAEDGYLFPTFVKLEPVPNMYGTDYPTCLYKSGTRSGDTLTPAYPMKRNDFVRITSETGWESTDKAIVIDAPSIAAYEEYRTINVKVKGGTSPDSSFATFIVETMPNDSDNFPTITKAELEANVKKLHFYNYVCDFATSVEINRSSIDPIYYETLWQTYHRAAKLESVIEEPLYYVLFTVNDYPTAVPIYHNDSVKFSDTLSHAIDGVRSSELFKMDGVTPNIINMRLPTKHKYKVKFHYPYQVYKDIYIITDDDFPAGYKPV